MSTLFLNELEQTAIQQIKKFAKIAEAYNFDIAVGFSGGKDSQVVYDLCKRADVPFTAYYNVAFESPTTKKFIKEYYPEVVWRKDHKFGFIENIAKIHSGLLPTVRIAYCCEDYKHNPKYVDKCSIIGVRRQESNARANRTTISYKNKTTKKNMGWYVTDYFKENCQSVGTASVIQLCPIIDWSDTEVWEYIHKHQLPINPDYKELKRIGCIVCPKANFNRNFKALLKYPRLIDAFIWAKSCATNSDWIINTDNKDYTNDKIYYICRWLNRSFMPFTQRQEKEYQQVKEAYEKLKNHDNTTQPARRG